MTETGDTGTEFNMDAAVSEVASGLNLGSDEVDETERETELETDPPVTDEPAVTEPPADVETLQVRPPPKSWAKEQHEHWAKVDPKVQEYIELREKQMLEGLDQYKGDAGFGKQLRDVITPYTAVLKSQGVEPTQAVQHLLNAHYKLSTLQPSEKQAYFAELGRLYGVDTGVKADEADPRVKQLEDRINKLQNGFTAREQAALTEARSRVAKDVETFASDPAHLYFDEVADDIVAMIQAGHELKDAYEKAVWANPVTRQKEIARLQQENEAKTREKAKTEAEKARKASSSNVRSRDTRSAPTEPKGSMEDTMKETLRDIKSRAH